MKTAQVLIVDTDIALYDTSVPEWDKYSVASHRVDTIEQAYNYLTKNKCNLVVIVENVAMRTLVIDSIKPIYALTDAPLIIASHDPIDAHYRILAHDMGADDIWEMPPTIQEAVAKGYAFMRRHLKSHRISARPSPAFLADKFIIINEDHRSVLVKGREVELVKKEFDLLRLLMSRPGWKFTYDRILDEIWGEEYGISAKSSLYTQMEKLRGKIQIEPDLPHFIKTTRGVGYSFDPY